MLAANLAERLVDLMVGMLVYLLAESLGDHLADHLDGRMAENLVSQPVERMGLLTVDSMAVLLVLNLVGSLVGYLAC